jgi:CBS domain-containing protein
MKVKELMTARVESCTSEANLGDAALIMWRNDCGIVPVTDRNTGKLSGVITDRDVCMGLATTGRRPTERSVRDVMSGEVFTVPADAEVTEALDVMQQHHVRRLPVTRPDGTLEGILSINDLILHADARVGRVEARVPVPHLLQTLKAICAHRPAETPSGPRGEIEVAVA